MGIGRSNGASEGNGQINGRPRSQRDARHRSREDLLFSAVHRLHGNGSVGADRCLYAHRNYFSTRWIRYRHGRRWWYRYIRSEYLHLDRRDVRHGLSPCGSSAGKPTLDERHQLGSRRLILRLRRIEDQGQIDRHRSIILIRAPTSSEHHQAQQPEDRREPGASVCVYHHFTPSFSFFHND